MNSRRAVVVTVMILVAGVAACLGDDALQIACAGDDDCAGVCVDAVCLSPEAADDGCGVGARWCDGACVDVTASDTHCGACGASCTAGPLEIAACVDGGCTRSCESTAVTLDDGTCAEPCVPTADGVERCNGADDDCDGLVDGDDDDLQTAPCGLAGVCASIPRACVDGVERCDDAHLATSVEWSASETRCDGLDNDCDGDTDEGCCADAPARLAAAGPHRLLWMNTDDEGIRVDAIAVVDSGELRRVVLRGAGAGDLAFEEDLGPPCPDTTRPLTVTTVDGAPGETIAACSGDGAIDLVRSSADGSMHIVAPLDRTPRALSAAAIAGQRLVAVSSDAGAIVVSSDGDDVLARAVQTDAIPNDARFDVRSLDGRFVVVASSASARRLVWLDAMPGGAVAAVDVALGPDATPVIVDGDGPTIGVVDAVGVLRSWELTRIDGRPVLTPGLTTDADTPDDVAARVWRDGREVLAAVSPSRVIVPHDGARHVDLTLGLDGIRVQDVAAHARDGVVTVITAGPDGVHALTTDRVGGRRCDDAGMGR